GDHRRLERGRVLPVASAGGPSSRAVAGRGGERGALHAGPSVGGAPGPRGVPAVLLPAVRGRVGGRGRRTGPLAGRGAAAPAPVAGGGPAHPAAPGGRTPHRAHHGRTGCVRRTAPPVVRRDRCGPTGFSRRPVHGLPVLAAAGG